MTRRILIDALIHQENDIIPNCGDRSHIRAAGYEARFTATLSVDGRRAAIKEFVSHFRETDDEEQMAQSIVGNMYATDRGVYDVQNPPEALGDELFIDFTPAAKELFEFLKKHKQKLLVAFTPSIDRP